MVVTGRVVTVGRVGEATHALQYGQLVFKLQLTGPQYTITLLQYCTYGLGAHLYRAEFAKSELEPATAKSSWNPGTMGTWSFDRTAQTATDMHCWATEERDRLRQM